MAIRVIRKPFRIGKSRAITLPLAWVNYYREKIDKVTIIGSTLLIIAPEGFEEQAEKLAQEIEHSSA